MKRIFIIMIMAAIMVGCHKANITDNIPPVQENDVAAYSGKLTLNVGESVTKAFDENLKWKWESGDVIYGYQNSGSKYLNQLIWETENTFVCDNFVYSTEEPADFYFFYSSGDYTERHIFPGDDGTWRPMLSGVASGVTLENIGTVTMNHLTSAIEFELFMQDGDTPLKFTSAKLSSLNHYFGYGWEMGDSSDDGYSFHTTLADNIEIDYENNPSNIVVFNVPIFECGGCDFDIQAYELTLTFTTVTEDEIVKNFKISDILQDKEVKVLEPGVCTKFKVNAGKDISAKLPTGSELNEIIKNKFDFSNTLSIVFTNDPSDIQSNYEVTDVGNMIYLAKDYTGTIYIYTPADKFKADADCSSMFKDLSRVKGIDFGNAFDASDVTKMNDMFYGCENLESLTLTDFPATCFPDRANGIFTNVGNSLSSNKKTQIYVSEGIYGKVQPTIYSPNIRDILGQGNYYISKNEDN